MSMETYPDLEEIIEYKGRRYLLRQFFTTDFSKLRQASQCYGIILNKKDEVLLISEDNDKWTLPGGTPLPGESYTETLVREIYEESAVVIDTATIKPFFYSENYEILNGEKKYNTTQLRFIAYVDRIDKFVSDPGGNVRYRRFVSIEELPKVLSWKKIGPLIQKHLLEYLSK